MAGLRTGRLVGAALRCYPASWRQRHGDEATELAALLIRDGTPAASIALSYLAGAAREWLTPRPGRRLSMAAYALLAAACALTISTAVVAETAPARAASTSSARSTHAACPAGSAAPIPAAIVPGVSVPGVSIVAVPPTVRLSRQHPVLWEASHGRSC
jgi:hypothetical protein